MLLLAEDQHCYCAEKADAAFLRVVPNRLQLFEYDSIFFDCEGFANFTKWRVMRRIMGVKTICGPDWETSTGPCVIKNAFEADSGEYWCEANGAERSNSVNVSVTAGSVILESPALPVMEGDDVTLSCRNRMTSSVHVADFYKDGLPTQTGSKGNMTIHDVSKSDEGLYKCIIVGGGESAESWLPVRVFQTPGETRPPHHHSPNLLILRISVAILLVALALLLVGLSLCGIHRVLACISSKTSMPGSHSGDAETVSGLTGVDHPQRAVYSCIKAKTSCTAEAGVSSCTATPANDTPSAGTTDEYCLYYTID
ncbi:low affinity immunoglobulin gamma Fc region receptor II-like [Siniperca chuatsi]|uniref:low affinity immunoglobulin gamma Fc region receptor II-like n=1 Tax=Siniperca chuatsi TaxID=119488 RepID=UPI001CE176DA|nr:low affinity immunoglobulin gamma Fc region receptor II-like [Siniperca chuatsi]